MCCNNRACGGCFGIGIGPMPRLRPFMNGGCGCNQCCGECGCDNEEFEPAYERGCGCDR